MRLSISSLLLLLVVYGCFDLDKWDHRYEKEARDKCECMSKWESELTPALLYLYQTADSIIHASYSHAVEYDSDRFTPEDIAVIKNLKNRLTLKELDWHQRLGRAFFDSRSKLNQCWNKQYSWSGEYPGNNVKYTVPVHAFEMKCRLVVDFIDIRGNPIICKTLFDPL